MGAHFTEITKAADGKYPPDIDLVLRIHKLIDEPVGQTMTSEDLKKEFVDGDYPFPLFVIPVNKYAALQRHKMVGNYCNKDIDQFLGNIADDEYEMEHKEPKRRAQLLKEQSEEKNKPFEEEIKKFDKYRKQ